MLGSVPRGMDSLNTNVPNLKGIPIPEQPVIVTSPTLFLIQPLIFPVGIPLIGYIYSGTGSLGQFPHSGKKIRVNMGFGDGHNTHPLVLHESDIAIHIPLRIDDQGLPGRLTTDDIGCLSQLVVIQHTKKHTNPHVLV